MIDMVNRGELDSLTPERVWKDTSRAMMSDSPQDYFRVLNSVHALGSVFGKAEIAFKCINQRLMQLADHDATESQRWMGVFFDVGLDVITAFVTEQVITSDLKTAIRFSHEMHNLNFSDVDAIMLLARRYRLWNTQEMLESYIDMCGMIGNARAPKHTLCDAIARAGDVGFSSLSQEEQETLQGPEIGNAIEANRKVIIGEWV
jgi:tRNA nucleotidyltransferase/poly(A) polymerase